MNIFDSGERSFHFVDAGRVRSRLISLAFGTSLAVLGSACTRREVVEQKPTTNNIFVQRQDNQVIDKVDLLYVVDNSASMGDKQAIFEQAVPRMLERLVQPDCVERDESGTVIARQPSAAPADPTQQPSCAGGSSLEFNPVRDIHVGVISTSLGAHGGAYCTGPQANDRSLLMPKVRPELSQHDPHGTGYLVWHPDPSNQVPVEADLQRLKENFRAHILAAGEDGCGFEAPLEAWYRFLVDPTPPLAIERNGVHSQQLGIDEDVLEQRRAFLRPDSLVAIVVLSDENDCSMMEGGTLYNNAGLGWMLAAGNEPLPEAGSEARPSNMPIATDYCASNPNDACCFSCFRDTPPAGCEDPSAIGSCSAVGQPRQLAESDRPSTRCFDGLRRFGVDLLYPLERYLEGLRSPVVRSALDGSEHPNPLLRGVDGTSPRSPDLVFFAGVTGVPWQDIADRESLESPERLRYLRADALKSLPLSGDDSALADKNHWDLILGQPGSPAVGCAGSDCGRAPSAALDPFMIESIAPRQGTHPLTGESITRSPQWNSINGHEQDVSLPFNQVGGSDDAPANDDLQYSCIFPLAPYQGIKSDCSVDDSSCDCGYPQRDRALCKEQSQAAAGTSQYYGKAYPASRTLRLLRDFGQNSVVASICPKIHDTDAEDYGYNPAIAAIVDRLSEQLKGQCLPRQLDLVDGKVPCEVVEVSVNPETVLSCDAQLGRNPSSEKVQQSIVRQLIDSGLCPETGCSDVSMCSITQLQETAALDACLNSPRGSEEQLTPGYCYVAPEQGRGNRALVSDCPASERQLLRFVGKDTPAADTSIFVACAGQQAQQDQGIPPLP